MACMHHLDLSLPCFILLAGSNRVTSLSLLYIVVVHWDLSNCRRTVKINGIFFLVVGLAGAAVAAAAAQPSFASSCRPSCKLAKSTS